MATATVAIAAPSAEASVSHCSAYRPQSNQYVQIKCTGNPGTSPNQYRAWAYCGTETSARYGDWVYVDPTDPDPSTVICPAFTTVRSYGYNTR